jgi:molybdate transport system permease protein
MLAGNIPHATQTAPLAIYDATLSGQDSLANSLVLILTLTSIATLFLVNRLSHER